MLDALRKLFGQDHARNVAEIGGYWDELGRLQYDFLVSEGLKPSDVLVDVGCGCLRAGVHLAPYLDRGHYLGMDRDPNYLATGRKMLGRKLLWSKAPELVCSDDFEFAKFSRAANWGIAQSLFTHLPDHLIYRCMDRLADFVRGGVLYVSYLEVEKLAHNPTEFKYENVHYHTREQMKEFGRRAGWKMEYLGPWNHPRNTVIVRYRHGY